MIAVALQDLLTKKQIKVLHSYLADDWKILINAGAVRSGKTYINNYLFLLELRRIAKLAMENNDEHPQYIIAGFSSNSIFNNIINSIGSQFGIMLTADRHGHYHLFGVDIVPAYTGSLRGIGGIRGMTSYGAYINEASLSTHAVFQEIKQRCSKEGARIICDTNPDIPTHWLKTEYIDNVDSNAGIKYFMFTIDDNPTLPKDYVVSLKASTPKGMFYDRAIKGLWVTGDGIVYRDFDKETMIVDKVPQNLNYYVGVDWGFEHKNAILVFGDDDKGNTYLVESHTGKHQYIDYWIKVAKDIQKRYGRNINYWCDSARPEHVSAFQKAGLKARNANKSILAGIEKVSELMTLGNFFILHSASKDILDELYQYVWNEQTGEPIKEHDDDMDAMRYAIYSQHIKKEAKVIKSFI